MKIKLIILFFAVFQLKADKETFMREYQTFLVQNNLLQTVLNEQDIVTKNALFKKLDEYLNQLAKENKITQEELKKEKEILANTYNNNRAAYNFLNLCLKDEKHKNFLEQAKQIFKAERTRLTDEFLNKLDPRLEKWKIEIEEIAKIKISETISELKSKFQKIFPDHDLEECLKYYNYCYSKKLHTNRNNVIKYINEYPEKYYLKKYSKSGLEAALDIYKKQLAPDEVSATIPHIIINIIDKLKENLLSFFVKLLADLTQQNKTDMQSILSKDKELGEIYKTFNAFYQKKIEVLVMEEIAVLASKTHRAENPIKNDSDSTRPEKNEPRRYGDDERFNNRRIKVRILQATQPQIAPEDEEEKIQQTLNTLRHLIATNQELVLDPADNQQE